MQCVILAGGKGIRFSEETTRIPKPLISIGNKPIIWHIMKLYSFYGINDFIICSGYKSDLVKEYFANYLLHSSDVYIDVKKNTIKYSKNKKDKWKIHIVDSGLNTMTGGRVKRISHLLQDEFCLTYGDGVSDINIKNSIAFHKKNNKIVTMSIVKQPGRFGIVKLENNIVKSFVEKPYGDSGWINGGFFIMKKKIIDFIKNDESILEKEPFEILSKKEQIAAYKHENFWYAMDSLRDQIYLENLYNSKNAPWKVWE